MYFVKSHAFYFRCFGRLWPGERGRTGREVVHGLLVDVLEAQALEDGLVGGQHGRGLALRVEQLRVRAPREQDVHALRVVPLHGPVERGPTVDLVLRVDVHA